MFSINGCKGSNRKLQLGCNMYTLTTLKSFIVGFVYAQWAQGAACLFAQPCCLARFIVLLSFL
jgi:hypothetical protein